MRPSFEDQKKLNKYHAENPQPGDYWEEHLVGVCVVLEVTDQRVVYCPAKRPIGDLHWTWDLGTTSSKSREEFDGWLAYGSIHGYWADVHPREHEWAVIAYNNAILRSLNEESPRCP